MKAAPVKIRQGTETDWPHIVITWLKSFARSDFARYINVSIYRQNHKRLIQKFVETSDIILACAEDDETFIFGYVIYEFDRTAGVIVHYLHVKPKFRRYGIGKRLLMLATGQEPYTITHYTKPFKWLKQTNYKYDPYLFLEEK